MSKATKQKVNRELTQQALARDGKMLLTDAEKAGLSILIEKQGQVEAELQKCRIALSGMIAQVVQARGLDVRKFGVNLGAGRILPIDHQQEGVPAEETKEEVQG